MGSRNLFPFTLSGQKVQHSLCEPTQSKYNWMNHFSHLITRFLLEIKLLQLWFTFNKRWKIFNCNNLTSNFNSLSYLIELLLSVSLPEFFSSGFSSWFETLKLVFNKDGIKQTENFECVTACSKLFAVTHTYKIKILRCCRPGSESNLRQWFHVCFF